MSAHSPDRVIKRPGYMTPCQCGQQLKAYYASYRFRCQEKDPVFDRLDQLIKAEDAARKSRWRTVGQEESSEHEA